MRLASPHVWFDRRGITTVEYVVILALIAIAVLSGWRLFGVTLGEEVVEATACIGELGPGCETSSTSESPQAPSAVRSTSAVLTFGDEPTFDGLGLSNVTYARVPGRLFITGAGDQNPVDPNDVVQGNLGDCSLMSAIISVARYRPDIIQNMIRDNGDGTYTVTFHDEGLLSWGTKEITVTADLPQRNGRLEFAKSADRDGNVQELWPAILEKAYAQWSGGYPKLVGTDTREALGALTGKSSEMYGGRRLHELFGWKPPPLATIRSWLDNGDAVVAGTLSKGNNRTPLFNDGTLSTWHAYVVVAVDEQARTVTLRNPWGWAEGEKVVSWFQFKRHFISLVRNPVPPKQ